MHMVMVFDAWNMNTCDEWTNVHGMDHVYSTKNYARSKLDANLWLSSLGGANRNIRREMSNLRVDYYHNPNDSTNHTRTYIMGWRWLNALPFDYKMLSAIEKCFLSLFCHGKHAGWSSSVEIGVFIKSIRNVLNSGNACEFGAPNKSNVNLCEAEMQPKKSRKSNSFFCHLVFALAALIPW